MSDSGKQSPLGINVLGSLLGNTGLTINSVATSYMGSSKTNSSYTFGSIVQNTALRLLTYSINDAYLRGPANSNTTVTNTTYTNLIQIGSSSIPALGNSKPPTYIVNDPSGIWTTVAVNSGAESGPATAGYPITSVTDQGQQASWLPYDTTNSNMSITQWGYLRLHALQAWNEFNWNGTSTTLTSPEYKEFCSSFMTVNGFINQSNQSILTIQNSASFLQGVYSNMDDLISADIAGVSLSTFEFGTDLVNLGKAIDLSNIATFGLPSNLLINLNKNNCITQDLSLALLAAGLSSSDITNILSGTPATKSQEQQIYGAFLIITGDNLIHTIAPLQCKTTGLTSLADLLNVKSIFPNSYSTLTVPVYNSVQGLPTNSKTYYLIYTNGNINSSLSSAPIIEYVGTQIVIGSADSNVQTDPSNYVTLPAGFGSYLAGILPADQAIAAGAFSFTMRQINNIQYCDFQKFAKAVQGLETTAGLPDVSSGTNVPTNATLQTSASTICALGSGPYGTYTFSDFFGCMSGLPYPWQLIQQRITDLTSNTLQNIYQELFLATTWEQATGTVQCTTTAVGGPTYTYYYTVTGITLVDRGGGYGRGGASAPTVSISGSSGATATCTIGTDNTNAGSNTTGNFGRVLTLTLTSAGTTNIAYGTGSSPTPPVTGLPSLSIQAPPIDILSINTDGSLPTTGINVASGTTGWNNPMNLVVQAYINQANAEIANIQQTNIDSATHLNTYWNTLGTQLKIEQRSRYIGLVPVPVPKNYFMNQYPLTVTTFVDSIPQYALSTAPHMAAQTLEAISDQTIAGGQSVIGLMRQERNQTRLLSAGINLDNNIPAALSTTDLQTLTSNGTLPGATNGIGTYTNPAWPQTETNPIGYMTTAGYQATSGTAPGDITPILNGATNPVVGPVVPVNPIITAASTAPVIIQAPAAYNPNNLPSNLDPKYTSSTLMPATQNIAATITKVTDCNCDCQI